MSTGLADGPDDVPKYRHFAVLLSEEQFVQADDNSGVKSKMGFRYMWFDTEDEFKDWVRTAPAGSYRPLEVHPLEVKISVTITKESN